MPSLIKELNLSLIKRKITLSVAESCTGGLLSSLLTQISGSSKYFKMAIVAYSDEAKIRLLRINRNLIKDKGAVSKDIASAMAKAIRKIAKTDLGVSVTGIAGPTGATERKPVGMVFIAIADRKYCNYRQFIFRGSRKYIRLQASLAALRLIKKWIQ
ncbi:MAG: CinA family protein [Candidatus Omnitrophota bacterium]